VASGTFGTLAGIPLFLGLSQLPFWAYLAALAAVIILAVYLAARAEGIYGQRDDGRIVIDEVAGYLVTMVGVGPSLGGIILGFILFRAFDILKPWPARLIDRKWRGGLGLVLDDVAAGVYACAVLHVLIFFWPALGGSSW